MDISARVIFCLELIGTVAFAASGAMAGTDQGYGENLFLLTVPGR